MLAPSVAKPQKAAVGPAGRRAQPGTRGAAQRPGAAEHLLMLQRSIGNQATAHLLARQASLPGRRGHEASPRPQAAAPGNRRPQHRAQEGSRVEAARVLRPAADEAAAPAAALLARGLLQARLELGATDDPLEREAEATALRVMRRPAGGGGGGACCSSCAAGGGCEGETTTLRRAPAGGAPAVALAPALEGQVRRLTRGGEPLPPAVRAGFEPRFGADLSGVRVHRDAEAASASRAVGARAFALGNHIGFGAGQWAPGTPAGDHLIAHELAHALQRDSSTAGDDIRRYSWDELVDDVTEVGGGAIDAVREVGGKVAEEAGGEVAEVAGDVGGRVAEVAGDVGGRVAEVARDVAGTAEEVGGQVPQVAQEVLDAVAEFGQEVVDAAAWVVTEAGKLALRGANALAKLVGGSVTVTGTAIIIDLPAVTLFDSVVQELSSLATGRFIPILPLPPFAIGPLEAAGAIALRIGNPTMIAGLGPARLENVRLELDPFAGTYAGTGAFYLGGAVSETFELAAEIGLQAAGLIPFDPPIPVAGTVEGGIRAILRGVGKGGLRVPVVLGYAGGALSLGADLSLQLGAVLEVDAELFLKAILYGKIDACSLIWPLKTWRLKETAEQYDLPIGIGYAGGAVSVDVGPPTATTISADSIVTPLLHNRPPEKCLKIEELVKLLCKQGKIPPEICQEFVQPLPGFPPVGPMPIMPPGVPPVARTGCPDGTSPSKAIEIIWCKPIGYYPEKIRLSHALNRKSNFDFKMFSGGSQNLVTESCDDEIGIREWPPHAPFQIRPQPRRDREKDRFKHCLDEAGFEGDWTIYQADHVRESSIGGDDEFHNLWPLDAKVNSSAGLCVGQGVWLRPRKSAPGAPCMCCIMNDARMEGKWVKVVGEQAGGPAPPQCTSANLDCGMRDP